MKKVVASYTNTKCKAQHEMPQDCISQYYKTYELDLDKIETIEDCKKILKFLCRHTLKPLPVTMVYRGFEDVEEYFK